VYLLIKRVVDILISSLFTVVLFLLFIPLIIVLRLTGEGKVFYKQSRVGFRGIFFGLIKFATMLENSPNIGTGDITVHKDPRVLPIGRFLRKTKINELPQLINILSGDMSLVGPRPLTPRNFDYYPDNVKEIITSMKPGLTGIGSIVFRDEESIYKRSKKSHEVCYKEDIIPYKGALEIWYKNNQSFMTDLKIIFLTAWVIFFPQSNLYLRIFKNLPEKMGEKC
jgi:lipopolysaccharide/colanic/teichoic acid biosynthesis glycosyltransferase